ncbi:hypothetical protein [Pseudaminobacter soli (ex Li et al. 2025)]|uniref:Uncharacterized protein n=1 Tax=Pseudaminobacter soli (ex Li et al. 2025) TaxID=1295366 RepID=A0A2P7SKV9_9HYPH|nr:hypothetical protein [Mesorhizobium soli]PSJ63124.1 hypothetical protein C7I85_06140 [Mesorhizobium soli]
MAINYLSHETLEVAAVFCKDDDTWDWQFHMDYLDVLRDLVDEGLFNEGRPEDDLAQSLMFRSTSDLNASERHLFEESLQPLLEARCSDPVKFAAEYQRRGSGRSRQHRSHQGRLAA